MRGALYLCVSTSTFSVITQTDAGCSSAEKAWSYLLDQSGLSRMSRRSAHSSVVQYSPNTDSANCRERCLKLFCICTQATKEYSHKLVSGHATSCPWRDTVCDASLGRFPKLPARDVYLDYNQRYNSLNQLSALPAIDRKCLALMHMSHR